MTTADEGEAVLILTPIKDAVRFVDSYFSGLARLTYPAERISLGILESDSDDASFTDFAAKLEQLGSRYDSAKIWRQDFGFRIPFGLPRWHEAIQLPRRATLAKARNHLLFRALDEQDWVLWLDVDIVDYPSDLIEQLLATGRDIVHPHCVLRRGGPTFDRNGWRDHGRVLLEDLRDGPDLARLDAVGGTVLLVRADIHRDGLIFPSFLYGTESRAVRRPHPLGVMGEIETEGLGIMALDMGHQCWGMPKLEVIHASETSAPPKEQTIPRRQVRMLSCLFDFETNSEDVANALDAVTIRAEQSVPVTFRETIGATWTGDAFLISGGGVADASEYDVHNVVEALYRRAQDRAVAGMSGHGFVPAACGWHGTGHFLLLGAHGYGKTSLALRLMVDGFDFSGDAWVLLHDGLAVAWPRRFILGESAIAEMPGLVERVERLRPVAALPRHGMGTVIDPVELRRQWRIAPAPVSAIFDLEPNFGARTVIRPSGKIEMMRRVMTRALAPSTGHAAWLTDVCAMVEQAATYVVELGDLDSAAAVMTECLRGKQPV